MYRLVLVSSVLVLSACAASDPPIVDSNAAQRVTAEPTEPTEPTESSEPGQIEFTEAPAVPEQAAVAQPEEPQVVCQLERRTGTNRKVRVCRQQTTATDAARAQETFDSLRRQQIEQNRPTRE